jgi:4-amino-4-deoxy-L-arabinose transferase-like glycosyltransferase
MLMKKNKIFYLLVALILAMGIFLRFWRLGSIPPGIQYDEAYNGINAIQANETGDYKLFFQENTGREGVHIDMIAFFIKLFGVSNYSLRIANAMWGSLTLIGFYFLLRELKLSKLSVLLGIFILSFSFWHLDFSRTAFRAIMVPMVIIWSLYFLLKALHCKNKQRSYLFFVIAGACLGFGIYTYIAFRVAPLIFILFGLTYASFEKKWLKKNWQVIIFFTVASVICALPILIYFYSHSNDFWSRADAVSIFNSVKMTPFKAFLKSLSYHLRAFFIDGDPNPRHNYDNQPLIPTGWMAFLVLGFVIAMKEIIENIIKKIKFKKINSEDVFRPSGLFYPSVIAQSIFWVMLIPGALSIEGIPHSLRIIGMIPGVFILCILPMEYILKIYRKMRDSSDISLRKAGTNLTMTFLLGLAMVIVSSGIFQVYVYFDLWANDLRTASGFEKKLYLMGLLIKKMDIHKNNYVITAYNTAIYADKKTSSLKTVEFIAYPKIRSYLFYHPLDGINNINCDDAQIIFQESDQWLRNQYRNKCPGMHANKYSYNKGKYVFFVMLSQKE